MVHVEQVILEMVFAQRRRCVAQNLDIVVLSQQSKFLIDWSVVYCYLILFIIRFRFQIFLISLSRNVILLFKRHCDSDPRFIRTPPCVDLKGTVYKNKKNGKKKKRTCKWVGENKKCNKRYEGEKLKISCPVTCGMNCE